MRALSIVSLTLALAAGPALAQDSVQNGSAAVGAGSDAAGHLAASGVQTAVGASVVPTAAVGSVAVAGGASAMGTGLAASEAAGASANATTGPLKVDDKVVVSPDPAPNVPYQTQTNAPR